VKTRSVPSFIQYLPPEIHSVWRADGAYDIWVRNDSEHTLLKSLSSSSNIVCFASPTHSIIRGLGSFFFWRIFVRIRIFSRGVVQMFTFLCDALDRTDTRDAITEILQYSARLTAGLLPSFDLQARRVYKSLSEGRKIFRLFRFVPEMKALSEIQEEDIHIYRLNILTSLLSTAFYMLDNFIYYLETVKRKSRGDIRPVKLMKNRLALLRTLSGMLLTILELNQCRKRSRSPSMSPSALNLWIRLWHDTLRLWLTMHKLHLLSLFLFRNKVVESVAVTPSTRYQMHILPGAIGLASAITSLVRRTLLRSITENHH